MSIEIHKRPQTDQELENLFLTLIGEFIGQGLIVRRDPEFGGFTKDYFGMNVGDYINKVNLGFLQIIFELGGWTALAPQNELGERSLKALASILKKDPESLRLDKITIDYAMFRAYFPYSKTPNTP